MVMNDSSDIPHVANATYLDGHGLEHLCFAELAAPSIPPRQTHVGQGVCLFALLTT